MPHRTRTITKKSPNTLKGMNVRKLAKHLAQYARQAKISASFRANRNWIFCNHSEINNGQTIRISTIQISKDNKALILDLIAEVYALS